jgi:hypothetical protein
MSDDASSAQDTLVHYFRTVWEQAGLPWIADNETEVRGIVRRIVDASVKAARHDICR